MVLSRISFSVFTLIIIGFGGCRISEKKVNAITKIDNSMEEEGKEQPKKPLEYTPLPKPGTYPKGYDKVIIDAKIDGANDGIVIEGTEGDRIFIGNVVMSNIKNQDIKLLPPLPKKRQGLETIINTINDLAVTNGIPNEGKQRIKILFEEMVTKLTPYVIIDGQLIPPEKRNEQITDSIIREHLIRVYKIAEEIKCEPIMRYMETI